MYMTVSGNLLTILFAPYPLTVLPYGNLTEPYGARPLCMFLAVTCCVMPRGRQTHA